MERKENQLTWEEMTLKKTGEGLFSKPGPMTTVISQDKKERENNRHKHIERKTGRFTA